MKWLGPILILFLFTSACKSLEKGEKVKKALNSEAKSGLEIEFGMNQGFRDHALGQFRYITATITNDSTIPIHLKIALSGEYEYPTASGSQKYKAFLLPKELTPDTAALYNNVAGIGGYLDNCLDKPSVLDETLAPDASCVITIGTLFSSKANLQAVPRAVFSKDNSSLYRDCLIHSNESPNPDLELGLKVVFCANCIEYENCTIIPFGEVAYPEQ